jgi:hypothetical protein
MTSKRKREDEPSSSDSISPGATPSNSEAIARFQPSNDGGTAEIMEAPPAYLQACRSALVKSPAASRAALTKHRVSLDRALVKALETVGGYEIKVVSTYSSRHSEHPPSIHPLPCYAVHFPLALTTLQF